MRAEILRGNVDLLLLAAVLARRAHGYAVIDELRRRSGGAFDLPEGTVYSALTPAGARRPAGEPLVGRVGRADGSTP